MYIQRVLKAGLMLKLSSWTDVKIKTVSMKVLAASRLLSSSCINTESDTLGYLDEMLYLGFALLALLL